MYLAKVIGSAVATQKDPQLEGAKLMLVQLVAPDGRESEDLHVAVDAVGAGIGNVVIVVIGSGARLTEQTKPMPVDATIVGIVDTIERSGSRVYAAAEGFAATSSADSEQEGPGEAAAGGEAVPPEVAGTRRRKPVKSGEAR